MIGVLNVSRKEKLQIKWRKENICKCEKEINGRMAPNAIVIVRHVMILYALIY